MKEKVCGMCHALFSYIFKKDIPVVSYAVFKKYKMCDSHRMSSFRFPWDRMVTKNVDRRSGEGNKAGGGGGGLRGEKVYKMGGIQCIL